MAPAGQPAAQQPQALQTALMMWLKCFSASYSMAPYGQREKQVRHPAAKFVLHLGVDGIDGDLALGDLGEDAGHGGAALRD